MWTINSIKKAKIGLSRLIKVKKKKKIGLFPKKKKEGKDWIKSFYDTVRNFKSKGENW